jgi:hypothetical protein
MSKRKAKVEFLNNSHPVKCWGCNGDGCKDCNNTGIYREDNYIMIATNSKGERIAFQVDSLK